VQSRGGARNGLSYAAVWFAVVPEKLRPSLTGIEVF